MKTVTISLCVLILSSCIVANRINSKSGTYILAEIVEQNEKGVKVQVLDAWFPQVKFHIEGNTLKLNNYDSERGSFSFLESDSTLFSFLARNKNDRCNEIFHEIEYLKQSPIKVHEFDDPIENKYVIFNIVWAGSEIQYFNVFDISKKNIKYLNKNYADCSRFDLDL